MVQKIVSTKSITIRKIHYFRICILDFADVIPKLARQAQPSVTLTAPKEWQRREISGASKGASSAREGPDAAVKRVSEMPRDPEDAPILREVLPSGSATALGNCILNAPVFPPVIPVCRVPSLSSSLSLSPANLLVFAPL